MKEIKFRAWNGDYFEFSGFSFKTGCLGCNFSAYVELDTPQQFTGLKDSNGVDIYEGDIVEDEEHYYSVISWDNDNSMYVASDVGGLVDMNFPIKVIGNIHENPNLLTTEKVNGDV